MRFTWLLAIAVALGCGSSTPTPTNAPGQVGEGGEEPAIGQSEGRWHHFWAITEAREAIIRGDLKTTRALLERFSIGDLGEDYPTDWLVFIEEIQDEADRAQYVKGRRELAGIVSAIAARCGECHRSNRKTGPQDRLALSTLEQRALGRSGVSPPMGDHRWAVEQLWIGMTIPNHQAWVAGTRALTESPLHVPPPPPAPEGETAAEDEAPPLAPGTLASAEAAGGSRGRARGRGDRARTRGRDRAAPANAAGAPQRADAPVLQLEPAEETPADARKREQAAGLRELVKVGQALYAEGHPLPMAREYAELISRCADCHRGGR